MDRSVIDRCESAVWRDLVRAARGRAGAESQGRGSYSPGQVWTGGGFGGWYPIGTWAEFRHATRDSTQANRLDLEVMGRMQRAGAQVGPGVHLLYRIMYPSPVHAGVWKTLYLGSAKHGHVAYRLQDHFAKTEPPGGAWHSTVAATLGAHWQRVRDGLRVQAGPIAGHRPQPLGSRQASIDYNELVLMEKILQRRYQPLFWDPDVRTFE
jgi:hypothetical protein